MNAQARPWPCKASVLNIFYQRQLLPLKYKIVGELTKKEGDAMEVKVKINTLIIKDKESGEEYTVQTVRTAKFLSEFVQESEKEEAMITVEEAVVSAYKE